MHKSRLLAIFITLLMFSSVFGLIQYIPVSSASPPPSSISNTAYLNSTVSYWQNIGIANSGTTDAAIPVDQNGSFSTYSFGSSAAWSLSSNTEKATYVQTLSGAPNYAYLGDTGTEYSIEIDSVGFQMGVDSAGIPGLGTLYANLTVGSYTDSWSYYYNYISNSANTVYAIATPQWDFYVNSPWNLISDLSSATITFTATAYSSAGYGISPYDIYTTIQDQGQNTETTSGPVISSVPFAEGYYYGSVSSSFSPSYLTAFAISWSGPFSTTQATYGTTQTAGSGTFTGSIVSGSQTISFGVSGDPSDGTGDSAYTVDASYYLSSQVQAQSFHETESNSQAQNPTENQNWWNSSSTFTISNPTNGLDNTALSTTSGTINAGTYASWNVNHIAVAGYGESPVVDIFTYSGQQENKINLGASPPEYESISQGTNTLISSSGSPFTYNFAEFINYDPSIVNSHAASPVNPLTPLVLYANGTEQISGEQQNLAWSPNGAPYSSSAPASSEAMQSSPFSFSSVGSKSINWYIHNDPNGNPASGAELNTSIQQTTVNVFSFSLTPSPVDYSSVGTSILLSLAYSTQTSAKMTIINLTVNGVLEDRFQPGLASGTVKYDFTQPVASPLLVTWTATDQFGYSQSITFQYGAT